MRQPVARISIQRSQVGWISGISKQVQVHNLRALGPDPTQNKIRANKACPARDQYRIQVEFPRRSVYAVESAACSLEAIEWRPCATGLLTNFCSEAGFSIYSKESALSHTRPGLLRQSHSRETMAIFLDGHRGVDVSFRPINAFRTGKTH
jgi:hypothetical protein